MLQRRERSDVPETDIRQNGGLDRVSVQEKTQAFARVFLEEFFGEITLAC